jgi:hypothetical protein
MNLHLTNLAGRFGFAGFPAATLCLAKLAAATRAGVEYSWKLMAMP